MSAIARTIDGPYGRFTLQKVCGLLLISVTTFLLCLAVYIGQGSDFNHDETDEEVTVTASGYLGISTKTIDNINRHLVTSYSSTPVDLEFQGEDGHDLFTISNLLPSSSLCFESEEPLVITASSS